MTEEEMILTAVKKCRRVDLYADCQPLSTPQRVRIDQIKLRRQKGEPLQYLLGSCEFMGLSFKVDSRVLIPRPETELLVETVIHLAQKIPRRPIRILDLGTGSGNIAISLAKFIEGCQVSAVDICQGALDLASENARLNGVEDRIHFIQGDLFSAFKKTRVSQNFLPNQMVFDMIISNPPYIPSAMIGRLAVEVQKEPRGALDGGADGLDFYRHLVQEGPFFLKEGALMIFEMGDGQREAIEQIVFDRQNLRILERLKDYRAIERIMIVQVN